MGLQTERYTTTPFPAYRYLPGKEPHPRTHPRGHGYGTPEPHVASLDASDPACIAIFRFGVDLFNAEFFWESHEAFEALWRAAGQGDAARGFFQGLIQIAAAHLKRRLDQERAAQALAGRGLARLEGAPPSLWGLDVRAFARDTGAYFRGETRSPPRIVLAA